MPRIIKPSDGRYDPKVPRTFTCDRCGCVFEAEVGEYKSTFCWTGDLYHSCECPECHKRVFLFEF